MQTYQQLEHLSGLELFYRHTRKAVNLMMQFVSRTNRKAANHGKVVSKSIG